MNSRTPRCPEVIYGIWKNGSHRVQFVDCGKWACPRCSRNKIVEITGHLASVTVPEKPVYDLAVPARSSKTVRNKAQAAGTAYLGVTLAEGGLYMVVREALSGLGWATTEHPWEPLIVALPDRLAELPRTRVTWTGAWKPEKAPRAPSGLLYRAAASSRSEVAEILGSVGLNLDSEWLDMDPEVAAEKAGLAWALSAGMSETKLKLPKRKPR